MKRLQIIAVTLALCVIGAGFMFAVSDKEKSKKHSSHDGININIDLSALTKSLESLKDLKIDVKGLEKLGEKMEAMGKRIERQMEGFKGFEKLKALEGLKELKALQNLDVSIKGLEGLKALENIDISIKGLDSLGDILESSLKGLKGLEGLKALENLDIKFDFDWDDDEI